MPYPAAVISATRPSSDMAGSRVISRPRKALRRRVRTNSSGREIPTDDIRGYYPASSSRLRRTRRNRRSLFRRRTHISNMSAYRNRRRGCDRSEEHTSELQSLMRISYAVFCLKTKNSNKQEKDKQPTDKQLS